MVRNITIRRTLAAVFLIALVTLAGAEQESGIPPGEEVTGSGAKQTKELELIIEPDVTTEMAAIDLMATHYRREGNFDAAIAEFRKIIKLCEQNALDVNVKNSLIIQYMRKIAACYKSKGDFNSAIEEYRKLAALAEVHSLHETVESAVLTAVECALQSDRYEEAVNMYADILGREVQNETVLLTLAYLYRKHKRYDEAIAKYRKFVENHPDSPHIDGTRYDLGNCYIARVERSGGPSGCCGIWRGEIPQEALADYEAALREFKTVLDYSTSDVEYLHKVASRIVRCYRASGRKEELDQFLAGHYERFLSRCREVIAERPKSEEAAIAQYYLGMLYMDKREYDKAKEEFDKVLSMKVTRDIQTQARLKVAWILREQGHYSQAIEQYQKALDTTLKEWRANQIRLAIAGSYYEMGNFTQTKRILREIIDLYPNTPWARKASLMLKGIEFVNKGVGQ